MTRRVPWWTWIVVILLWVGGTTPYAAPKRDASFVVVPFVLTKSGHIIIDVSFNGLPALPMLVDTAAGISLLDKRVARELGLPYSARHSSTRLAGLGTQTQKMKDLHIADLEIGMAVFPAPEFYTTDLKHIRYIKAHEPVVGILGTDFLRKHKGIVNYVDQTLTLSW